MARGNRRKSSGPQNVRLSLTGQPPPPPPSGGGGQQQKSVPIHNGRQSQDKETPLVDTTEGANAREQSHQDSRQENAGDKKVSNNSREYLLFTDDRDLNSRVNSGDHKSRTGSKKTNQDPPSSPQPPLPPPPLPASTILNDNNKNETEDSLRRKRRETIFVPNDTPDPNAKKKEPAKTDIRHRLKIAFRSLHALFVVGGIGLIVSGFCVDYAFEENLRKIGLHFVLLAKRLYIGSGAAVIVMAIIGQIIVIVRRCKILTWLIYLLILCLGACSTGTAGFTCLRSYKNHTVPRYKLFDLMQQYNEESGNATQKLDAVHQSYECCGVDNFTDWNDTPFGRTSLRTPMTCCRNHSLEQQNESCGQNLLPYTDFNEANKEIFARGCIKVIMRKLDWWYLTTGLIATILACIIGTHFFFCFFLITSHRL